MVKKQTNSQKLKNSQKQTKAPKKQKRVINKIKYIKKSNVVIPEDILSMCKKLNTKLVDNYVNMNEYKAYTDRKELEMSHIKLYEKNFKKTNLLENISNTSIEFIAHNRDVLKNISYEYSNEISTTPYTTNQGHSGRCWIFACLNILRHYMINEYKLDFDFELSAGYIAFYDKLEKASTNMEKLIDMIDSKFNEPKYIENVTNVIYDGGHWGYFKNLIEKYGIVPLTAFYECYNSYITDEVNKFIKLKMLDFNKVIRELAVKDRHKIPKIKEKYIQDVYNLLRQFIGRPADNFDWKYRTRRPKHDEMGDYVCKENLTPIDFYEKYVCNLYDINAKISLVDDRREHIELYKKYSKLNDSNMINGELVINYTTTIEDIKEALMKSIDNDEPCYIACDVEQNFSYDYTLLSDKLFDYDKLLNLKLKLTKKDLHTMYAGGGTHAMCVVGYDKNPNDKYPNRWKIQNSWGRIYGMHGQSEPGYIHMMDDWFDNHVYEVVIDKKYLSETVLEKYENCKEVIELGFFD